MSKPQSSRALDQAIRKAGGIVEFTRLINSHHRNRGRGKKKFSRFQAYRWQKAGQLPAELVICVEDITGISRTRLRSDIYPS